MTWLILLIAGILLFVIGALFADIESSSSILFYLGLGLMFSSYFVLIMQ